MFLIGLRDDVLALSPRQKLFSQFLPVIVLVFLDNVVLVSLYGFVKDVNFSWPVAYLVSVFTVIIITNAYNLIDGIDGLAGSIGILALFFYGTWFYVAGQPYLRRDCIMLRRIVNSIPVLQLAAIKNFYG